jgi:hypothetical protein
MDQRAEEGRKEEASTAVAVPTLPLVDMINELASPAVSQLSDILNFKIKNTSRCSLFGIE